MQNGTIIYFSHGGGPMPLLEDPGHKKMISFMQDLPKSLKKPDEILVISAHWEEGRPTIVNSKNPSLLFDYYGFPKKTYNLNYAVSGNPHLAEEIQNLLLEKNISSEMTQERGLDHGVFIPLLLMYPHADIPVTEISLIKDLNPKSHINMGKALRKLSERNILIIGSGFSFHNMSAFSFDSENEVDIRNNEFQDWLIDTCCGEYNSGEKEDQLINWEKAPHARYCHPREEHLLPLHVCFGISEEKAEVVFDDYILGKRAVAFKWH